MNTPNPAENPNVPTLEERVVALECAAIDDVGIAWHKVNGFIYTVTSHLRNISYVAVTASLTALILKLYHYVGL